MDIRYSEKAEKQIKRIYKGDKKSAVMIIAAIENFATHSAKQIDFDVKILKGKYGNFKRLRVGNYRVIFEDDNTIMLIFEIKHRQEAYHD
jgi:mRNA interferase RelE/StbE